MARGVTLTVRNNRLSMHPPSAYSALSDEELLILRHHREVIKQVVRRGGTYAATTHEPAPACKQTGAPTPHVGKPDAPAPEPVCQYCGQQCVGPEHDAYEVLHWNDPEEVKSRDDEATKEMLKRMRYGNPY